MKWYKWLLIIIAVLIVPFALFGSIMYIGLIGPNLATVNNYDGYSNDLYGIKIDYIPDWEQTEEGGLNGTIIAFLAPRENGSSIRPATISIAIENISSSIPIEGSQIRTSNVSLQNASKFVLFIPWNLSLDEYTNLKINFLKSRYNNIQLGETTLAGYKAHNVSYAIRQPENVSYAIRQPETDYKVMQVWTLKDEKAYIFTYVAEESKYQNYLPVAQRMIQNFSLVV
jgi:hypothetical protein